VKTLSAHFAELERKRESGGRGKNGVIIMKTNKTNQASMALISLAVLILLTNAISVTAQSSGGNYKVTSSVVAGGGSQSTGSGNKVIEGTAGQSAAGPTSNSNISHVAGFWPATLAQSQPQSGLTTVQFSAGSYVAQEDLTVLAITVTRSGDSSGAATVDYWTNDGAANQKSDFEYAAGHLKFAPGETAKTFLLLLNEDMYAEGNEALTLALGNPVGATLGQQSTANVTLMDDAQEPSTNPIDDPQSFVHTHYHDFLNREPDASGLAFWTNTLTGCGGNQACIDDRRITTSAAFFLSIEFQGTGYLVERLYKTSYGDALSTSSFNGAHQIAVPVFRLHEFLPDAQQMGQGVVVGQAGWDTALENNKQAFTSDFVQRARFASAFPAAMTAAQFVDKLNANAGNPLSSTERDQLVSDLAGNAKTRAQVLRAVAEHPAFVSAELNRAFVLMQYFGYLRRNPDDPQDSDYTGYDFWLTKLNQFGGNYVNAEMVKAFITSIEYRQRFGQ